MIRDAGTTQVWHGVHGMGLQTRIFAGDGLNVLAGERVRLAAGPYTYVLFDDAELDVPDPETVTYEKPGSREGACPHAPVLFDDAELDVPDPETVTYEYNTANEPEHSHCECAARQAFSAENAQRVRKMRKAGDSPRARSHACRRTRLAWYSPRFPRRTVSKYQGDGSVTHAEYTWFAGNQLKRVDSTFPGECDVAYITDGLGKRRLKSVDPDGAAAVTWYRYDAGWNEIASYNDSGDFWDIGTRSSSFFYAGMTALARVGGSNPSSSLWWQPYMDDHPEESQRDSVARQALRSKAERVGSARAVYSPSKALFGARDYLPYGEVRQAVGIQPAFTFTGKRHDAETGLYYFPYRYYSPTTARWLSRDPLGMVDGPNVYEYVEGSPINHWDRLGLLTREDCERDFDKCAQDSEEIHDVDGGIFEGVEFLACMAQCQYIRLKCSAYVTGEELVECVIDFIDGPYPEPEYPGLCSIEMPWFCDKPL